MKIQAKTNTTADRIASQAEHLEAALASADIPSAQGILRQLSGLAGAIPGGGRHASRAAGAVMSAITQAHARLASLETAPHATTTLQGQFDRAVYKEMNVDAKRFYDQIDTRREYVLYYHGYSREKISGGELRDAFANVQYHALSKVAQQNVLKATAKKASEYGPWDTEHLQASLEKLQAYSAGRVLDSSDSEAMQTLARNGELFQNAMLLLTRMQANQQLIATNPSMGNAALSFNCEQLSMLLSQTLLPKALYGNENTTPTISHGLDVMMVGPVALIVAATTLSSFRA